MNQIQVVKLGDFGLPDIQSTLGELYNSHYCNFTVNNQHISIPPPNYKIANLIEEYSFKQLENILSEYRINNRISNKTILIGIINRDIEKNYFGFTNSHSRYAVINIKDIEKLVQNVTIQEFLVSEIAQHAVAIIENHDWHKEPRRCLFDFCGDKRDIISTIFYRTLCQSCDLGLSYEAKELLQRSFDCIKKIDPITNLSEEIKKMTKEPKRTIKTQNYFEQGTHTHTHNYAHKQNLAKTAAEIQELLNQLQKNNCGDIQIAVSEEIKRNPNFRDRLRSALKEGGIETLKQLFAPLNIPIEFVRGWVEAEDRQIEDK